VTKFRSQAGFSLIELLVATGLLLIISSIVTSAIMQATKSQTTIFNRTEMHSGIRGATELLQQEVGQAGLISLPATVTISANPVTTIVGTPTACVTATTTLTSVAGMWGHATRGVRLTFLDGDKAETIQVTAPIAGNSVTGCFWSNHPVGTRVMALGGFAEGIIPPASIPYANGSNANRLKLFGDINGDGTLQYVEYYCDNGDAGTNGSHNLYRNVMEYTTAAKPALTSSNVLLSNVYPNPPDTGNVARPCFKYQTVTINNPSNTADSHTYVLDVAITLTVQTQQLDPITRSYQTETKALLNVSPRNVFNTWMLAGNSLWDRVQPTPPTIAALLPTP
jgi:prepilin-type N-terminal cleavage/methylation domain-containing protein